MRNRYVHVPGRRSNGVLPPVEAPLCVFAHSRLPPGCLRTGSLHKDVRRAQPVPPGDTGLSAVDAHYSMAPFFINHDEALGITGRWPECRFGNVCLWNRFQQTLDYTNRSVSLNRAQTDLEADGSFRLVIAHEDPGTPNWLDTEGNLFGLVFWRFFLARGDVETPRASVVKLADLKAGQ